MTMHVVDGAEITDEELALARRYPMVVMWSPEDGVFAASFPDISGLKAYGTTAGEAAQRGDEVVALWVAAMLDAGRSLPNPSALPLSA